MGAAPYFMYVLAPLIILSLPCLVLALFVQQLAWRRSASFGVYFGVVSLAYLGFWLYTNPENPGLGFMFLLPASPVIALIYVLPLKLTKRLNAGRRSHIEASICEWIKDGIRAGQRPSRIFRDALTAFPMAEKADIASSLLCAFPNLDENILLHMQAWQMDSPDPQSDEKLDTVVLQYLTEAKQSVRY